MAVSVLLGIFFLWLEPCLLVLIWRDCDICLNTLDILVAVVVDMVGIRGVAVSHSANPVKGGSTSVTMASYRDIWTSFCCLYG